MAQRVSGYAKKPPAPRGNRVGGAKAALAEAAELRALAFDLGPAVAPYKKKGRLSIRVERLPHQARLSQGRNNGDRSFSLTLDELEDLEYLFPESLESAHSLAVRIISLDDGDGSTLAVLDIPVSPADNRIGLQPEKAPRNGASIIDLADSAELLHLRDELAKARATLQSLETRHREERKAAQKLADAALAQDRAARQAEEDDRFAALEQRVEKRLLDARAAWEQEAQSEQDAVLAAAEAEWKVEEAARIRDAEAKWRAEAAHALEAAAKAAKSAHAKDAQAALIPLQQQLAVAQEQLAARDAALKDALAAKAGADADAARVKAALQEAEQASAELENKIAQQHSANRAAGKEAKQAVEAALAKAEAETRAVKDETAAEVRRLQAELAAAQKAIVEAQAEGKRASEAALGKAEAAWKSAEATRLSAAEAAWRETAARDATAAKAAIDAEKKTAAIAVQHLQAELDAAQKASAEAVVRWQAQSAAELADAKAAWQRESDAKYDAALAGWKADVKKAEAAWREEAGAQLAAAKEEWQAESDRRLADVQGHAARAEAAIAKIRDDAQKARGQGDAEMRRLREDLAKTQALLSVRDAELADAVARVDDAEAALARVQDAALTGNATGEVAQDEHLHEELRRVQKDLAAQTTLLTAAVARAEKAEQAHAAAEAERASAQALSTAHGELQRKLAQREEMLAGHAQALADAVARAEMAEAALLEAGKSAQAAEDDRAGREAGQAALQARIASLESALAEHEIALMEANARAEEAAENYAQAQLRVQSGQGDSELRRLRRDLSAVQAALAQRERELEEARLFTEQAHERWQRKTDAILAKAEKAWHSAEAARLSAARAEWQEEARRQWETAAAQQATPAPAPDTPVQTEQSVVSLAHAAFRPEGAHALARDVDLIEAQDAAGEALDRLRQSALDILVARNAEGGRDAPAQPAPAIASGPATGEPETEMPRPQLPVLWVGGIAGAALLVAMLFFLFAPARPAPRPAPPANAAAAAVEAPAPAPVPVKEMATLLKAANLRATPSPTGKLLTTLRPGMRATVLVREGKWVQIELAGQTPAVTGWVFSTLLQMDTAAAH